MHHALRACAVVVDELVIVIARAGDALPLPNDLDRPVTVVRDDADHPGPLAATLVGARAARGAKLLVVAGDMPALRPALLTRLLAWRRGEGACLSVDGEHQVLPFATDRARAVSETDALLLAGERSLRALLSRLAVEDIPEAEWRAFDPAGESLRDVDRPTDLKAGS